MPLWWNPLICCPTAHYFPNDIWDATVKETERSISPAFQSNLLWEGNNMSIFQKKKRKKWRGWAPVWVWARSLKPQRLVVALGVIINFSSKGDVPSKTAVVAFYIIPLCFRLEVKHCLSRHLFLKNDLVECDEKESLWCKSTAIICTFSVIVCTEVKVELKYHTDWGGFFCFSPHLVQIQSGTCPVRAAIYLIKQLKPRWVDVFPPPVFVSPGGSVSRLQHQPLCGKHNTETNHSQVSGHWSSVISDELMAPLNGQQGSQGNISMNLNYWSSFRVKKP